jgi:uncharacterized protein YlxP (DUF503 family)
MKIGTGTIKFRLFGVNSLKEKRKIIKSIISRIQNKFNISIAETGLNDSHDWALIGFAIVGNETGLVNSKVDKIFNMAEDMDLAMVADTEMEIIHL